MIEEEEEEQGDVQVVHVLYAYYTSLNNIYIFYTLKIHNSSEYTKNTLSNSGNIAYKTFIYCLTVNIHLLYIYNGLYTIFIQKYNCTICINRV